MLEPNPFTLEDFRIAREGIYRDELGSEHALRPVDFLADYYAGELKYPAGDTYIQPWARPESAETRLIFSPSAPIITYPEHRGYEEALYFYNSRLRQGPRRNLALSGASKQEIISLGIDHCNDCALESEIWLDYMERVEGISRDSPAAPTRLRKYILLLIDATGRRPCHNLRADSGKNQSRTRPGHKK
jgi:hypothetical protein